jgi:hypothetical protein
MYVRLPVILIAAVLLLSLGALAGAQVFSFRRVDPPIVLSGGDIGFRIVGHDGTRPVGALVVRIDGNWVPVKDAPPVPGLATQ